MADNEKPKAKAQREPDSQPHGKKKGQQAAEPESAPQPCAPPDIIIEN